VFPLLLLVAFGSCDSAQSPVREVANADAHPGASAIEPGSPDLVEKGKHGQTFYVPAYGAIPIADNAQLYQLAITLSIRNTDRTLPIIVTAVGYHHQDGRLVRDLLKTPLRVAPLASLEFFVRAKDTSAGTVSSFLVDCLAERDASSPIVESVMVGTSSSHGIAFTCPGRVVAERFP
jgi:hypothetical protein